MTFRLLFRKFAADFAQKYKMPTVRLDEEAQNILSQYRWAGNIRQLRNIAEQISVLEKERDLNPANFKELLARTGVSAPCCCQERK